MLARSTLLPLRGLVATLAVACCPGVDAAERPSAEFQVVFKYIDLNRGTWSYELNPAELIVRFEGHMDQPRTDLCNAPLTTDQAAALVRVVSRIPLEKLPSEYVSPDLDTEDGAMFYFTFAIRNPGVASRTIRAVPRPPPELADLCKHVMALVPAGCGPGATWFCD